MNRYILIDDEPVAMPDLMTWARWLESADREVGKTHVGDVLVSTVFLGIDHNFGGGPPILFETMIFGGKHDGFQERYTTLEAAKLGHAAALKLATPRWRRILQWVSR